VLEALAAGCLPVLPNRLVYPEIAPASGLYADAGEDIDSEARHAADLIERQGVAISAGRGEAAPVDQYAWRALKGRYIDVLSSVAASGLSA